MLALILRSALVAALLLLAACACLLAPAARASVGALEAPAHPGEGPPVVTTAYLEAMNGTAQRWWRRFDAIADLNRVALSDGGELRIAARNRDRGIIYARGLLTRQDCERLITTSLARVSRSTVVDYDSGASVLHTARTSRTAYLAWNESEIVSRIERRLSEITGLPRFHGEPLQLQQYGEGAQYEPHHDFFDPVNPGASVHLARGGQRVLTAIVYLNEPDAGGATVFPDLGLEFVPEAGAVLIFASVGRDGQLDKRSLHGGKPVVIGSKWIATLWVRAKDMRFN
jgi:prolyl 4-hydroxylase